MAIAGPDLPLNGGAVTSFALLLHEFATNAAKYGALSTSSGRVDIECFEDEQQFVLTWTEREGPTVERREDGEGSGSLLARATVKGQLGGVIGSRKVSPSGCPSRERGSPAEEECVDTLIISGEETYVLS